MEPSAEGKQETDKQELIVHRNIQLHSKYVKGARLHTSLSLCIMAGLSNHLRENGKNTPQKKPSGHKKETLSCLFFLCYKYQENKKARQEPDSFTT